MDDGLGHLSGQTPLVAGQWQRTGSEFDLVITENKSAPNIPVGGKLESLS